MGDYLRNGKTRKASDEKIYRQRIWVIKKIISISPINIAKHIGATYEPRIHYSNCQLEPGRPIAAFIGFKKGIWQSLDEYGTVLQIINSTLSAKSTNCIKTRIIC